MKDKNGEHIVVGDIVMETLKKQITYYIVGARYLKPLYMHNLSNNADIYINKHLSMIKKMELKKGWIQAKISNSNLFKYSDLIIVNIGGLIIKEGDYVSIKRSYSKVLNILFNPIYGKDYLNYHLVLEDVFTKDKHYILNNNGFKYDIKKASKQEVDYYLFEYFQELRNDTPLHILNSTQIDFIIDCDSENIELESFNDIEYQYKADLIESKIVNPFK